MSKATTLMFEEAGETAHPAGTASPTTERPTVLVVTTHRWYPTARLVMALANAGCRVEAVCPSGHPLSKTGAVRRVHDYNGLMPLMSLARAIEATNPFVVIPGDDLATEHLHQLYQRESRRGKPGAQTCALIERSLGAAERFEVVNARSRFIQLAQEEGVRVPKTEVIKNTSDLRDWMSRTGFPFVLKADGTSGGDGVKVVKTVEDAERAFRRLQAPPLLARAVKRAIVDRDFTLIGPSLSRHRSVVNAQSFITGREATSAMVCWNGAVLASLHFEVLGKVGSTGHATVVRLIEHPEMSATAQKVARCLGLSGFHGLDFMLEAHTGNAHLIEINPRTTQVGHLALGSGHDLPAALFAAMTGKDVQPAPKVTENDTIALFPQEWKRDPASPFLLSGYHDVPWDEPALVSACVSEIRRLSSPHHRESAEPRTVAIPVSPASKSQAASWIAEREEV